MPAVTVSAPLAAVTRLKAYLVNADGSVRFSLPWAPQETTLDGLAPEWATIARPARKPVPRPNTDGLLTLSFSIELGSLDIEESCEPQIATLRALASSRDRVRFSYGADGAAAGWWVISSLSITSKARAEATNAITRASAQITLTEYVTPAVTIGKTTTKNPSKPKKPPATYVVKKGDTLFKIAVKVYGNGTLWRRIAKANKIKDTKKLRVGQRLKIPKV